MNAHADIDTDLRAFLRRELTEIQPAKLSGEWSDDAVFTSDLGLDSLDLVELVARLEQSTGLFVPDDDLERLTSVAATANYIRARKSEGA